MILHTIIDINEVLSTEYINKNSAADCKRVENCIVYGVKCKEGFRVDRLFSTNPSDYINPQYQIGNILK